VPDASLEDIELVGRAAAGDQDAFADLFDRHAPLVLANLAAIAANRREAEEALVEAFVRAWKEIEDYSPAAGTPESWLLGVARAEASERLSRARGDGRERASGEEAAGPGGPGGASSVEAPSESARRKTLWRISRLSNGASLPFAIGLVVALVAILIGSVVLIGGREHALKGQMMALARAREQSESSLKALHKELAAGRGQVERLQLVARIMASSNLTSTRLSGGSVASRASAHVFVDSSSRQAVFFSRALPRLPAGKAYQLWFSVAGKPTSGGAFLIDRDGGAILIVDGVPRPRRIESWLVTLEPRGGATQPTGLVYLKG